MRLDALGKPITPKNVLVKVGQKWNKMYVVIYGYEGSYDSINPELMKALDEQLEKEHKGRQWKSFDYIEILGDVT